MVETTIIAGGAGDATGGAQSATGGADHAETTQSGKRAYDGILGELKAERTKRREIEERIQEIESQKLLEQGKLKEYSDGLKTELDKAKKELNAVKTNYAFTTVKSQIERKASELGCIDSDLLLKAIDMDKIQVDDNFSVDQASLGDVLEAARKTKPYLFKQEGPKFRDGTPGAPVSNGKADLTKMTKKEIIEYAKKMGVEG